MVRLPSHLLPKCIVQCGNFAGLGTPDELNARCLDVEVDEALDVIGGRGKGPARRHA